nr:MAG TPA_asm: hypothetical protein [Caudoviricetes sp.]
MYGGYNPYAFNPYNQQYLMQQQQMQQIQQMQQSQPESKVPGITVVQVPTIDHVEQIQMLPGERKIVLVQNNPDFLAIRVADNAGFVNTEYRMSQVFDPKAAQQQQQVQYAPLDSVVQLKKELDDLKKMMEGKDAKSISRNAARSE